MSIEIKGISKSYGGRKILTDLSLTLENGVFYCIMAPSGKGKTTLSRIILGLEKPDRGCISGVHERLSAVFQEDRLCESLSVFRNIRIACPTAEREEISRHLAEIGLSGQEKYKAGKLSGGQKRRLALVRAVLADADLTVLDEPFTGLDPDTRKRVILYIKEHLKSKTVILITHDRSDADAFDAKVIEL